MGWTSKALVAAVLAVAALAAAAIGDSARADFSSGVVYDDAAYWQNWSWNTTVDPAGTSPVFEGSRSMAVTHNAAWAGLSFHAPAPFYAGPYTHLRFTLHPKGRPLPDLRVMLHDSSGGIIKSIRPASTWTQRQAAGTPSQFR
ncbi:MAG: hypothetical protein FJ319_00790 [SAR202 cluster bacterium]|nr:hypothetical protein [SAR202 cluster bacterium]